MSVDRRLGSALGPCLLLLLALCCAACKEGPPATEVLVVVDGVASTRAALVRLEVQVFKGRELGGPKQMIQVHLGPDSRHDWPISFSIAANDQGARDEFRVVITGFDANQMAIVEQQAITNFQPNQAGRLDLFLYAGCAGLCRAEGALGAETCGADGRCTLVPVLNKLPEAEPDELGGYTPVMLGPGGTSPDGGGSPSEPSPGEAGSSAPADADTTRPDGGTSPQAGTPAEAGTGTAPMEAGTNPREAGIDGGPTDAGREAGPSEAGMEANAPRDAEVETGPAYAADPVIPTPSMACPSFVSGATTIMGAGVQIYAGAQSSGTKAPLLFYWHGTGGSGAQVSMIPSVVRNEILNAGGIIVAPNTSVMTGSDISGTAVWHEGDLALSDLVTGCAVRDHNIDPRRIYVMGCSSGGLAAGVMGLRRARYVAASAPNSGGLYLDAGVHYTEPGATRVARVMTMHGPVTSDIVIENFATMSLDLCRATRAAGAVAIDCDHGAGHCGAPAALQEAAWRFMKDHPYGLASEPYASGLPPDFPSYCRITTN